MGREHHRALRKATGLGTPNSQCWTSLEMGFKPLAFYSDPAANFSYGPHATAEGLTYNKHQEGRKGRRGREEEGREGREEGRKVSSPFALAPATGQYRLNLWGSRG